jgi:hypothetical protein
MPAPHAEGDRVWMVSSGAGRTAPDPYLADVEVTAKLRPYNSAGTVSLSAAEAVTCTTVSRATRPYAPRDVLLNGEAYPEAITGELAIDWTHRNRRAAWSYADGGETAGIEPGCGYRLRLYGDGDTLFRTETDLTGTTFTWSDEADDSGGDLNGTIRVVLDTVAADGTESFQRFEWTVVRGGYGEDYGAYYG